jgi:hypothetical protein
MTNDKEPRKIGSHLILIGHPNKYDFFFFPNFVIGLAFLFLLQIGPFVWTKIFFYPKITQFHTILHLSR